MTENSFTVAILVDQSPEAAFEAIIRPRDWWGTEIHGRPERLDEAWTYRYQDEHASTQKTKTLVPGRKVVWEVVDSTLQFLDDKHEWKGTELVFDIARKGGQTEVRFTHIGLVPGQECFDVCTAAWSQLVCSSLKALIEQGRGRPDVFE